MLTYKTKGLVVEDKYSTFFFITRITKNCYTQFNMVQTIMNLSKQDSLRK